MFKWFMAKTLITKIIIVTSSVVIIGGATAGAVIIPKEIEKHNQEQAEIQLQQEKEEDLKNISIKLSRDYITIPYKGVASGITIERYDNLDNVMPYEEGEVLDKAKLTEVLKELFVENYTGGELTVDFDENINGYTKRGDYPITFTVTSEKGNTKSETAILSVINYVYAELIIPEDITIIKGTPVDIMEGVSFMSNLPEEEQGHIETEGTVDVNTVGTYTIKYIYVPKADETVQGQDNGNKNFRTTRTFKVIEETKKPETTTNVTSGIKLNTIYKATYDGGEGAELTFTSATNFKYVTTQSINGVKENSGTYTGTYTAEGNKVILKGTDFGEKYVVISNNTLEFWLDLDYYNTEDDLNV